MTQSKTPTLLITGATGNIGHELTKKLSAQEIPFRALVRSSKGADTVRALRGSEIAVGNFNDSRSIADALDGVDRAFLLTNSSDQAEAQQAGFVDVASRVGVKHIVKLSQWAADPDSPVRFLRYHAAVERRIQESGMAYTFLRRIYLCKGFSLLGSPT